MGKENIKEVLLATLRKLLVMFRKVDAEPKGRGDKTSIEEALGCFYIMMNTYRLVDRVSRALDHM